MPLPDTPAFRWFAARVGAPTPVQERAWALLRRPLSDAPEHALLVAPTGSGKTLAAFLAAIDRLVALPPDAEPGVRVLYVSPLKALVHDVEKNLQAPLAGTIATARAAGEAVREVAVDLRTGDTPEKLRRRFARAPADILVTTPESLYLLLGSAARASLAGVETVIVDEIHALADTKRGVHLALSLERLEALVGRPVQRVGLSATVRPLEEIAGFLGGGRPVTIVDTAAPPRLDLKVEAWLADVQVDAGPASFALDRGSGWPEAHQRILEIVLAHRTTLVFVNSRRLCERLALRLNEMAGQELAKAHHGSVAREQRVQIEDDLKQGRLRALVATGTLELGIDMGAIDHVVLVESPGSVARGLQRVGRAGHQVGGTSEATIFPRYRADLVECAVVARAMREGQIEAIRPPRNCLDVLAQHMVAIAGEGEQPVEAMYQLVCRAWPYRELPREGFDRTLDMLAGRYLGGPLADLSPRLVWDKAKGTVAARKGAATLSRLNAGAIPDRGLFGVFLGKGGPRVGELDEEMVFESAKGDTFLLGASTWKIEDITRDQVIVSPAPGEPGRMPFWRSDWSGRPIELGRAVGAFVREITAAEPEDAVRRLTTEHAFSDDAAVELLKVLGEQQAATGVLPTDRAITVERYIDEAGDTRVCILSPFGARVHAAWGPCIEARLGRALGTPIRTEHGEDGIMLRLAGGDVSPARELLFPDPDEVEDLLLERLVDYPLFAARFRDNAARALLLPRQRPGKRTPLWQQRIRGQNLLATVRAWPDFPILLETWRECLEDVFDLDGLRALLADVHGGGIAIDEVDTRTPSPLARSLAFRWVSVWMYEQDGPSAERRAQVLALDRSLLDALVGRPAWAELLDAESLVDVERELQRLAPGWRAGDADALHDTLRRIGELSEDEVAARSDTSDVSPWLATLAASGRALRTRVGGVERWIAAEDGGWYREALGADAPGEVAPELGEPVQALVRRYARTHGPFHAVYVARRWALPEGVVRAMLLRLEGEGTLHRGVFEAGAPEAWCDADVLRRLKRRALEKARGAVAALPPTALARMLPGWQGVGAKAGPERLRDVITQLEGCPLPFGDLEARILPARVPGYRPALLDELGALGEVVWVGARALGDTDGRIALYRRERLPDLVEPPGAGDTSEAAADVSLVARRVLGVLREAGASFLTELERLTPELEREARIDAVWELVWAGLVTNDTFQPLRVRLGTVRTRGNLPVGGRWGLVERLVSADVSPTRRALARAEALLARYGVMPPQVAGDEDIPGAGSAVYPALRALEEAGKVRRGWFVDGLGGAQFALPAALERLRRDGPPEAVVLAAADPANPYGGVLPWGLSGARRVAGARVVLYGGELAAFVDRGGRSVLLGDLPDDRLVAALTGLRGDVIRSRERSPRVERIDGTDALSAARGSLFLEAGFVRDLGGRGYTVPP